VVSFGQGCEGDPLMAARVIGPAIRLIREQTLDGTINMNTNASLPHILKPAAGCRAGQHPREHEFGARRLLQRLFPS
jgi:hypothetical protein